MKSKIQVSKRCPPDSTRTRRKRLKRLLSPAKPGGRPREVKLREVLSGIFPSPTAAVPGGDARGPAPGSTCVAAAVRSAGIQDRDEAKRVLRKLVGRFPRLKKLLADGIDNGDIAGWARGSRRLDPGVGHPPRGFGRV